MNRTLLFISLFSIFTLVSCQSSPKNEAGKQNEVELVAEKQNKPTSTNKAKPPLAAFR